MKITEMDFTHRTKTCLLNANIEQAEQLISFSPAQLLTIRNMGRRGLEEVEINLQKYGYL